MGLASAISVVLVLAGLLLSLALLRFSGFSRMRTLDNYRLVLDNGFTHYLLNSTLVTLGATLLTLVVSFLAAYAIVRGTSRALCRRRRSPSRSP